MATRMLQRRGTALEWSTLNPVLADGEIGWERDTGIFKVGDGVTAYNSLLSLYKKYSDIEDYIDAGDAALSDTIINEVAAQIAAAEITTQIPKAIIDAEGDLIVGSAADTVIRLAKGTNGQHLAVSSGGLVAWEDPAEGGGSSASAGRFVGSIAGNLTTRVGTTRIYNDSGGILTISAVRIIVGTPPEGDSIIADVNKNGTTIFTVQGARPTAAIDAYGSPKVVPAITSFEDGDYLTFDIDQVGSTVPGANFTINVEVSGGTIGSSRYTSWISGTLTIRTGVFRVYNDSGNDRSIVSVRATVSEAPVGSAAIFDVNKNGTTLFTTQGERPSIASTEFASLPTTPDVTLWPAGQYLTFDIDQVGSTTAGKDMTISVEVT